MHNQKEVVFGLQPVLETILAGKEIDKILIQKTARSEQMNDLIQKARNLHIPINIVPIEKLNKVTRKNHQGVICFVSAINFASLDNIIDDCYGKGKNPFVLLLDRVTDVRNFGAISRAAECAGVDAIVLPDKGSAQINSDALKTSAGALNYIPVCRTPNLKTAIQYLKDSGLTMIGCTEKTDELVYDADYTSPIAIIMGSEENGISDEYLKLCDKKVKIPMHGQIGSLNVSVATGIISFEVVRQRRG